MPTALDSSCSEMPEPLAELLHCGHGHPVWVSSSCLSLMTSDLRHQEAEEHVDLTEFRIFHSRRRYAFDEKGQGHMTAWRSLDLRPA